MGTSAPERDQLAAAIAAADQPKPVDMRQINVTIGSTGRPAILAIPVDATDSELAELAGWMLTAVMNTLRQERAAKPSIHIVRGPLPPS